MTTKKNAGFKKYAAGILAAAALTAAALPVYAETASTEARSPHRGNGQDNMIESLVNEGTISQTTYDAIENYMKENQPEFKGGFLSDAVNDNIIDQDTADKLQEYMQSGREKQRAAMENGSGSDKGQHPDRWSEMLAAGVITQEEYDVIAAHQPQRPADAN